ncbi:MAG: ABC transporter permease [Lachnospiraceae bacterium]|nr:ABC transporter permease [Lachnospiraceae bacterium]
MNSIKISIINFNKYRFLLYELVKKNIKLKYRRSYLGILWTLLEPLMTMIVLSVVFGVFFGRDDKQWPVYILTGRLLFSFFSSGTKSALRSINGNASMIRKVYVPKYMYVLANIISNFVTFALSLIVLVVVAAVLDVKPTVYMLEAIVPLFILFIITSGTSLILATLNVFFRDIDYIWQVGSMLISYTCAIFYPVDRLFKNGYGFVFDFNPVYMCIHNFRNTILYGKPLDMQYTLVSFGIGLLLMAVGVLMFYKKQDKFILYL